MQYSLSTLLIVLVAGPPLLAVVAALVMTADQWTPIVVDVGCRGGFAGAVAAVVFLALISFWERRLA